MNQRHLQNKSHVNVDVNLTVGNETQDKIVTLIKLSVSVKTNISLRV